MPSNSFRPLINNIPPKPIKPPPSKLTIVHNEAKVSNKKENQISNSLDNQITNEKIPNHYSTRPLPLPKPKNKNL